MRGNWLLVGGLSLVAVGALGLVLLGAGVLNGPAVGNVGAAPSAANGVVIFRTGASADGHPIPFNGSLMMRVRLRRLPWCRRPRAANANVHQSRHHLPQPDRLGGHAGAELRSWSNVYG